MVVVADQHLGVELDEPLQARARSRASVEQVAGEHQAIDPRAKARTAQGVLEELGEGVHVGDDQREQCRRLPNVFPHRLLNGHGHHVPPTSSAETGHTARPGAARRALRAALTESGATSWRASVVLPH